MNIRVAIIDDNKNDIKEILSNLNKVVEQEFSLDTYEFTDEEFESSKELFDLYLLDIDMPYINGIDLAKKINNENKIARIIFISRREDLVFNTFFVECLYFVRKDRLLGDLQSAMAKFLSYFVKNQQVYEFSVEEVDYQLNYIDICYFEIFRNTMYIVTKDQKYSIRKTMKQLIEEIKSDDFNRIHESFYVNFENVKILKHNTLVMKNGDELQVSRRKSKLVHEQYSRFLMNRG